MSPSKTFEISSKKIYLRKSGGLNMKLKVPYVNFNQFEVINHYKILKYAFLYFQSLQKLSKLVHKCLFYKEFS